MSPLLGEITFVSAPALSSAARGFSNSLCSKPSVARMATFFPCKSFITIFVVGLSQNGRRAFFVGPACFVSWVSPFSDPQTFPINSSHLPENNSAWRVPTKFPAQLVKIKKIFCERNVPRRNLRSSRKEKCKLQQFIPQVDAGKFPAHNSVHGKEIRCGINRRDAETQSCRKQKLPRPVRRGEGWGEGQ